MSANESDKLSEGKSLTGRIARPERPSNETRNSNRLTGFCRSCTPRTKLFVVVLIILVIVAVLIAYFVGTSRPQAGEPPNPVTSLPPSSSKLQVFQKAAVCTDAPQCSKIGRDVLAQNGSAVDAAIAAMFCNGVTNPQSSGIGGGFFMVIYVKQEERAYSVDARQTAPAAATADMFQGNKFESWKGSLSVGIPGEVRGMWEAHQRWGRRPWFTLIAPTLQLCFSGYQMSEKLHYLVSRVNPYIKNDTNLRDVFYDSERGEYHPAGTVIKPSPTLCNTLLKIAVKGGDELYNGSLAADLAEDLRQAGSIITAADLRNYRPNISEPVTFPLKDGDTLYTSPPPSSGVLLTYILNILGGYNFTADSIQSTKSETLTYHRILETFKFVYALRPKLHDGDFLKLQDSNYGAQIRQRINDSSTSNDLATYGAEEFVNSDGVASHISIIADNGDAVSVTTSINDNFGAGFSTKKTGIVLNNVMKDFSSPEIADHSRMNPLQANFIKPGKRPVSSMAPSIIVDKNGNAKLVLGASGGSKIISTVALVTMRTIWFGQSLKAAVDAPRLHHQLVPMTADYEYGITADVVEGLKAKGHDLIRSMVVKSHVCALFQNGSVIYGNADFRKDGEVAGVN